MPKSKKNSETDSLRRKIAARIVERCEMLGITRTQFAADLSIDPKTLQKYLRGDVAIPVGLWGRIAELLKSDMDQLFIELSKPQCQPTFRVLETHRNFLSERLRLLSEVRKSLIIYRPYTTTFEHELQDHFELDLFLRVLNRTLKLRYIQNFESQRFYGARERNWEEFSKILKTLISWQRCDADVEMRITFSSLGPPLPISFYIFDEEQAVVEWSPPQYRMSREVAEYVQPAMWCSGPILESLLNEYWIMLVNQSILVDENSAKELVENLWLEKNSVQNLSDEEAKSIWKRHLLQLRSDKNTHDARATCINVKKASPG